MKINRRTLREHIEHESMSSITSLFEVINDHWSGYIYYVYPANIFSLDFLPGFPRYIHIL